MYRRVGLLAATIAFVLLSVLTLAACAQQAVLPAVTPYTAGPMPDIAQLILDVYHNQKAAEAARANYTYHVHIEEENFASKRGEKSLYVVDAESLTVDGVRVNRVTARDGKPLTPEEVKEESARIDKDVADDKARRAALARGTADSDSRGDVALTGSRIIELGSLTNPRRVTFNGRPTIVMDYVGGNAHIQNQTEELVKDLVGTAWIDEQDHVLVRAHGYFVRDLKVDDGRAAEAKKNSSFEATFSRISDGVWLPSLFAGQGKALIQQTTGYNGTLRILTSDYRRFRTSSTVHISDHLVDPTTEPAATPQPSPKP